MKISGLVILLAACVFTSLGQASSSRVTVVTAFSENGKYFLRSIPFDHAFPTLPGTTSVYRTGTREPLYTINRAFDTVEEDRNSLVLSDDGEIIFYLISWGADEAKDGLKSVSIYKNGRLIKSYTAEEITGCDLNKERCTVQYQNYSEVVDKAKSGVGTPEYKKTFKAGVSDDEKFLSDFAIFSSGDSVYLVDSKKYVHRFSLSQAKLVDTVPFASVYDDLRAKARFTRLELEEYESPFYYLPKLRTGVDVHRALASLLKMKVYDDASSKDEQFRSYRLKITGYLDQNGNFDVEDLDLFDDDLPREMIVAFFRKASFDTAKMPPIFRRWKISDQYFAFRRANDRVARKERLEQIHRQEDELKRRLTAETVNGTYIPANLGEAFRELDRSLPEIDRKEMATLPSRRDMIKYHLGLGMWMRNNWGLWGGSRFQTYFIHRGITDAEEMSSVVLFYYWDWIHGNKDSWQQWESDPRSVFDKE